MTATLTPIEQDTNTLVIHFGTVMKKLSEQEFYEFCRLNDELRIELSSEGDLIIMPPTGGKTGIRNFKLTGSVGA
ncbi:MAG: Uma2 family endonuclease, partial [Acidobacteriota bacterium]|nr:Uma2 family endonuclease [Acidobacteriota bacterium]